MSTLEKAIEIAAKAHAGQRDKAGMPYILHPMRVMLSMPHNEIKAQMAAILHDVVEDSPMGLGDLDDECFPVDVVRAVDKLTHLDPHSYEEYIERVCTDPLAALVKWGDLLDHLRFFPWRGPLNEHQSKRYSRALFRVKEYLATTEWRHYIGTDR